MLKETQLCTWTTAQPVPTQFAAQLYFPPFAEDNLSLLTLSSIMAELTYLMEEKVLPLKVTARDHVVLEIMAKELPNVSSTSDPVFSQAMQLIDGARELDQKTWTQQFPAISDARVGRIVDFYLRLYDVEGIEYAGSLEDLSRLGPGLTPAQGYEKARMISLERDVFFKLSQKDLTLSAEEKLTPLAALSLAWWLHQGNKPTLAELSAAIYRPENKEIQIQATILYHYSHYGNRYGERAGVPAADLNNFGINQLGAPELPVSRAARALRVVHQGINAPPAILQTERAYLVNGFTPKNAQGIYLKSQSPELWHMILAGCDQIGFDACSPQDLVQFIDSEHAVGSLAFSLKTTLKLHYQLQGKPLDELEGKDTWQLYDLLIQAEEHFQQMGGAGYSPTVVFLSHFSQSNEAEPLTIGQMARAFHRIAGPMDVSHLSEDVQNTFNRVKLLAGYIIDNTATDVEQERFVLELKGLAQFSQLNLPLYSLAQRGIYQTEQEKIACQLDYFDQRLAHRHPPAAFNEDQAIRAILKESGVRRIDIAREYTYRQDPQFGSSQKKFDSPVDEFKRRRNASNRFVADMSMMGNNGRPINVFDTLDVKKAEYIAQIKSHPAIRAQAIEALINRGQRPEGSALQNKINALAEDYRPESEETRFWGNAWTTLENHWVCKLPVSNPMCSIARVEGPRYRNDNESMAAGMAGMVMEAGQLRGAERGIKRIENLPQGVKPSAPSSQTRPVSTSSRLPVGAEEGAIPNETRVVTEPEAAINGPTTEAPEPIRQTIQNPDGTSINVQQVELTDPSAPGGVRKAWVRQGGSGAYWEVDLVTTRDLGIVLKQGPEFIRQGRLPGGGPSLSKAANPAFNPEIKLGEKIGAGLAGEVYLDANNPGFVLKKLHLNDMMLMTEVYLQEVEFFNRYYGEGSAELIQQGDKYYIRMYRVPGKTLAAINTRIFPPGAKERFLAMMDDLGYYNIIHDDLNFNNVLYDEKTNTFYPIDFDNAYDGYYSTRDQSSSTQHLGIKMRVGHILKHIEEHTLT
jgi:hypothetical protein